MKRIKKDWERAWYWLLGGLGQDRGDVLALFVQMKQEHRQHVL